MKEHLVASAILTSFLSPATIAEAQERSRNELDYINAVHVVFKIAGACVDFGEDQAKFKPKIESVRRDLGQYNLRLDWKLFFKFTDQEIKKDIRKFQEDHGLQEMVCSWGWRDFVQRYDEAKRGLDSER